MGDNRYSGMAIASFVLSVAGFIGFNILLLLPSILGVIFGFIGLKRVKQNNLKGKGLAIAGIVVGLVALVITIFVLLVIGLFWVRGMGGPI